LITITAVSQTFKELLTSPIKSENPGVSRIFILVLFHSTLIKEEEIEICLSISFGV